MSPRSLPLRFRQPLCARLALTTPTVPLSPAAKHNPFSPIPRDGTATTEKAAEPLDPAIMGLPVADRLAAVHQVATRTTTQALLAAARLSAAPQVAVPLTAARQAVALLTAVRKVHRFTTTHSSSVWAKYSAPT